VGGGGGGWGGGGGGGGFGGVLLFCVGFGCALVFVVGGGVRFLGGGGGCPLESVELGGGWVLGGCFWGLGVELGGVGGGGGFWRVVGFFSSKYPLH